MRIDPDSLHCFDVLATTLNFRRAAERVALSPAALSDRIRRLEETVGATLFVRTTRRVTLSAAGQRLLPQARQVLEAHDRCLAVVREGREVPFDIRVGTRFELGLSWLVPALPRLEAALPAFRLHLQFADGPTLVQRVRQGSLDCALTSSRLVDADIQSATLHDEQYVLVGPRGRGQPPFRGVEDARRHTLLDIAADLPLSRYFLDQAGGTAAWRFAATQYLGTVAAIRLRLLQGCGIAVLPTSFVAADLSARRLRRLMPAVALQTDHFRLVWRRDHPRSEAMARLAAELQRIPLA